MSMHPTLIAPCGLNCRLCRAYIRERKPCPGCHGSDENKSKTNIECRIRHCAKLKSSKTKFCFHCDRFPCDLMKRLDKRYRTRYGVDVIRNLERIKQSGIRQFVRDEKEKWACPDCGAILCMHKEDCLSCGFRWR